uniref:Leukocyte cell-derived chemotaxin 1 n=1 Tax=Oncorhynchus kisutch TaxID=8019 RepID=A0A8C7F812_ONCKI
VAVGRLLRFGVATLVLMLCGSIGAFHLWKVSDKNVKLYLSFMGPWKSITIIIWKGSELGGSRNDEALEIHDFHTGITGIELSGGEKHYIKSQIKALQRSRHSTRMKFDEKSLTWVAADRPLKNSSFLSTKILDLCGDLPVFWLQTTYPKERRTRDTQRAKRQFDMKEFEAAAEEKNTRDRGREEGAVTFDAMLDHQGIFCSECRHSYTHCQRICEPLGYNYRGCQVSYRDILPCRWWVVCILGVVSVVHAHFLKPNSPKVLKVMFCKQQCHLYADIYCITLYLVANTG